MKKLLAILLALLLTASLVACGGAAKVDTPENLVDESKVEEVSGTELKEDKKDKENKEDKKDKEDKKEDKEDKKEEKPSEKPTDKKEEATQAPQAVKPVTKPSEKPATTPAPTPAPQKSTLGQTLLADFKAKAAQGMSAQAIADALLANSAIKFSGGSMAVEEGLLTGFDNAEITGFKSGVVFMPMIGSIPFIGYIFDVESSAQASSLIAKLEANANPRWNICVTADEVVSGVSNNKVFFVMCPTSLED